MKTLTWIARTLVVVIGAGTVVACRPLAPGASSPENSANAGKTTPRQEGYLSVAISRPSPARTAQAFPATTTQFQLTVTATDLAQPISSKVAIAANAGSTTATLVVPTGSGRSLKVEGLNAVGKVVASTTVSGLTVVSGQNTQVNAVLAILVGTVSGQVVDQDSGQGIGVVTVSADGQTSASTDASGSFTIADVTAGASTLSFTRSGYASASQQVLVTAGSAAQAGTTTLTRMHWVPVGSGTSETLVSVLVRSATEAWVTGTGGSLLHSTDGGTTWTQVPLGTSSTVGAVHFVDALTGYAISDDGLYRTSDVGSTWSKLSTERGEDFALWGTGSIAVLPYSYGASVHWSFDSGKTFESTNGSTGDYSRQLLASSQTQLWVAKPDTNRILLSNSSGASWQSLSLPLTTSNYAWKPLAVQSGTNACVAGYVTVASTSPLGQTTSTNNGSMACTQNAGGSWATAFTSSSPTADALRGTGLWGTGYCAVGTNGLIVMLPAGAASASLSLAQVPDPQNYGLNAVGFYGTKVGFAVGDKGKILVY